MTSRSLYTLKLKVIALVKWLRKVIYNILVVLF